MSIAAIASIAKFDLQSRIRAHRLEESLSGMVCDLCMDGLSAEEAFDKVQDQALERLISMLDLRMLEDALATKLCLEMVVKESERVASEAMEKGTAMLCEGLAILDNLGSLNSNGYIN
jgi:hypothetical protein